MAETSDLFKKQLTKVYHNESPKVTIYSNLADPRKGSGEFALWYYTKWADPSGSGKATIDLTHASETLGKSILTIKRYLRSGVEQYGLFRRFVVSGNTAVVYPVARDRVAIARGLEDLGVIAAIDVSDLKNLKFIATEVVTAQYQQASRYLARGKGKNKVTVPTPDQVLHTSPNCGTSASKDLELQDDDRGVPGILNRGDRYTYVSSHFVTFGVSQAHVAGKLDRSERTIKRRLDKTYRVDRGLEPIEKTQIAQFVKKCDRKQFRYEQLNEEHKKCFWQRNAIFRCKCNVYVFDAFDLKSARACRSFFRSKASKIHSPQ